MLLGHKHVNIKKFDLDKWLVMSVSNSLLVEKQLGNLIKVIKTYNISLNKTFVFWCNSKCHFWDFIMDYCRVKFMISYIFTLHFYIFMLM